MVKGVGGVQRQAPAHVINEYCHQGRRPFYPIPSFTEDEIDRSFSLGSGRGYFFPLSDRSDRIAIHRGCLIFWGGTTESSADILRIDLNAISRLREVRTRQYERLKLELTKQLDARPW